MTCVSRLTWVLLLVLMGAARLASAQQNDYNRDFQSALANYNAGRFSDAAAQLVASDGSMHVANERPSVESDEETFIDRHGRSLHLVGANVRA